MSHNDTHWAVYEKNDNGQLIADGYFLTLEDALKAIQQEVKHYGPMNFELIPAEPGDELYNNNFESFQFEAPRY